MKILESNKLRFGSLQNSNDPLENLLKRYNGITAINSEISSQVRDLDMFIRDNVSMLCTCIFKGSCLADQRWTLWSHYGHRHTGICFGINLNCLLNEIKIETPDCLHKEIIYTNKLLINPHNFQSPKEKSIKEKVILHQDHLLFSKHPEWEKEDEYRIVVFSKDFEINIRKCLNNITLGPDISKYYSNRIRNLCKKNQYPEPSRLIYASAGYAKPYSTSFNSISSINENSS